MLGLKDLLMAASAPTQMAAPEVQHRRLLKNPHPQATRRTRQPQEPGASPTLRPASTVTGAA